MPDLPADTPPTPPTGLTPPAAATPPPQESPAPGADDEKKFTQKDVDRILASRLGPLKENADKFDQAAEAAKTEAQKQADQLAALQTKVSGYETAEARRQAGLAAGLTPAAAALVSGDTPEQIDASVKAVQALLAEATGPKRPAPDMSAGQVNQGAPAADWLGAKLR